MKKLLLCLAVLLLSGCGKLPFDLPFTGSDAVSEALPAGEKTPPAPVVSGVSPRHGSIWQKPGNTGRHQENVLIPKGLRRCWTKP